jgi:hypothetical protein
MERVDCFTITELIVGAGAPVFQEALCVLTGKHLAGLLGLLVTGCFQQLLQLPKCPTGA